MGGCECLLDDKSDCRQLLDPSCMCLGLIALVAGIILMVQANNYEGAASGWDPTIQSCEITNLSSVACEDCDPDAGCTYHQIITLYAMIEDECGNDTLVVSNANDARFGCNDKLNPNEYNLGNEYDCYIKTCNDGIFSLIEQDTVNQHAQFLRMMSIVCFVTLGLIAMYICICCGRAIKDGACNVVSDPYWDRKAREEADKYTKDY